MTEAKSEDIKYALTNTKYKFYLIYGEDLVRYLMIKMYVSVKRLIITGIPIYIIIRIQGIDPCFLMNKNRKEDTQRTLLTQEFDINGPTVIEIPVNKENMNTELIKNYKHVRFDEGINDIKIPTPNYRHLWIDLGRPLSEDQEEAPIIMPPTL